MSFWQDVGLWARHPASEQQRIRCCCHDRI